MVIWGLFQNLKKVYKRVDHKCSHHTQNNSMIIMYHDGGIHWYCGGNHLQYMCIKQNVVNLKLIHFIYQLYLNKAKTKFAHGSDLTNPKL